MCASKRTADSVKNCALLNPLKVDLFLFYSQKVTIDRLRTGLCILQFSLLIINYTILSHNFNDHL